MKEKILYIVSFLLAFVLVTGLLIFLNSTYNNIFVFDFSAKVHTVSELKKNDQKESTKVLPKDSNTENVALQNVVESKIDSIINKKEPVIAKDSIAALPVNSKLTADVKPVVKIPQITASEPIKIEKTNSNNARRDSLHNVWVKNTAKLYEAMDTQKAAKIILGYSDNIARDLLLMMKKKKAAEILAEFKPETATRIISAVQ